MERSGNSAPVPCARLWYAGPCVGLTAGPRPTAASRQAGGQLGPASGGPGMGELAGWQPSPTFLGQGWGARLARKRRQTPQASTPLQSGTSGRPGGAIRVTSPPSGEGGHTAERGAVHGDVQACEGLERRTAGWACSLPGRRSPAGAPQGQATPCALCHVASRVHSWQRAGLRCVPQGPSSQDAGGPCPHAARGQQLMAHGLGFRPCPRGPCPAPNPGWLSSG